MAVLKSVQGKMFIVEVAQCLDNTYEVTIKLTGLGYEDQDTLKRIYKMGMDVQVVVVADPK